MRLVILFYLTGTSGSEGFGGNDEDSSQGGPACRKLKKRKVDEGERNLGIFNGLLRE